MRLRDLGPMVIEMGGRAVPVGGARTTAILAVLALRANQRVSVDVLLDVGWGSDPGPPPGRDRSGKLEARLETQIWRLRRVLEPGRAPGEPPQLLIKDGAGYRLLALSDEIDSARFEKMADDIRELVALGEFARVVGFADEALALWRGAPYQVLSEHPVAEPVITRLTETRRQVSARRVDALLETGAPDRALHDLDGLLTDAPFDEHLWAARMLALHRLGRTQEALQAYQDARRTLVDEVGIDPGVELAGLQRRILAGDPDLAPGAAPLLAGAAAPSSPHPPPVSGPPAGLAADSSVVRLPPTLTPLLGRADILARLTALAGTNPLLTIIGPAGCGKTRLAIELARDLSGGYRDGTWFIDLASVQEASLVTDFVLATIGIDPPIVGTALDGLRAYCRDRAFVLLLDNCEHVLTAAGVVAASVAAAARDSRVLVLATSREPLDVEGEVLWTLGPLALPTPRRDRTPDPDRERGRAPGLDTHPIDTGTVTVTDVGPVVDGPASPAGDRADDPAAAPAVALFLQRMRANDPGRELSGDELGVVVEICTALDGLPLAIELAAARVRSATLGEIAAQVVRDPSGLRRLGRGGRPDRSMLRDAIDAGYRLLSEPEQMLHRRLAVLPGSFTRDAAAATAAGGPLAAGEVSYLLDALVHRSLLIASPSQRPGGPTSFRQLATVRGHAWHALSAAAEETDTAQRRDRWVGAFVAQRPRLGYRDDTGWYLAAVDALPTIRSTLEHTLVHEPAPAGMRLLSRLTMFWYFHSRMAEGQRWGHLAERAPTGDPVTSLTVQVAIAAGEAVRGRADLAVPRIEGALAGLTALRLPDADPGELVELGDHYAPLAVALASSAASTIVSALSRSAEELAGVSGDRGLAVLAQALQLAAAARSTDPQVTAADSAQLYERASEIGHLAAAQVATGTCVALALATRDPAGRVWAERSYQLHRSQGGAHTGLLAESSANFAAFAGDPYTAVRLLSASRATARRAGTTWPRHPITRSTLTGLETTLARNEFDRAWREGLTLGPPAAARR